jgi:hypothetical protein
MIKNVIHKCILTCFMRGCHMGVQKTYEAVRQNFFWQGMYQHIYDYIISCKTWQIIKRNTHVKRTTMHPLPVQDVFARWHMDILSGKLLVRNLVTWNISQRADTSFDIKICPRSDKIEPGIPNLVNISLYNTFATFTDY